MGWTPGSVVRDIRNIELVNFLVIRDYGSSIEVVSIVGGKPKTAIFNKSFFELVTPQTV